MATAVTALECASTPHPPSPGSAHMARAWSGPVAVGCPRGCLPHARGSAEGVVEVATTPHTRAVSA
eukprot:2814286-Pleurochrysis_carterae.AAC.1